ncbi:MAG: D-2-hydroxyacid dehydrogenase [Verrucomicrobiales bacterium]
MKLVILDGHTLNPGDLDWAPLHALAGCTIYDRTPDHLIINRAAEADLLLTNKTPLVRETINSLPAVRYIGVLATGYNVVDIEAASARRIPVTNVPGYGTPSVAQHVFALLLELAVHTGHHAQTVAEGRWWAQPDFCYWDRPLVELSGKTLGVVGWGAIGRRVGQIAEAFGMTVLAAARESVPSQGPNQVRRAPLDELFAIADVISLHCPLTAETEGLVNAGRLALMRPSSYLINTARGPLVVEQALADALNAGRLAGAGLDVLSIEPPHAGNPLLSARNCVLTPHIAWATSAARGRLLDEAADNVRAFLDGRPRNVVNA